MTKELKSILSNYVNQNKNWEIYLISNWKDIMGKLKEHATLEKVEKDTLIISVTSSSWLQELYLLSNVLIKQINSKLPAPYVKKLKFKLEQKKKFKTREKKDIKKLKFDIKLSQREEFALKKIKDEELSNQLKKFLIKCKETR